MKHFTLFAFLMFGLNAMSQSVPALIAVSAEAETAIEPNMAHLQIESWSKGASAEEAQKKQAVQFAKVKTAVEKYKIKKEDFKSMQFSLNPDYVYDQKTQSNKITGYRASHQIKITFRKVEGVGSLIDGLALSDDKNTSGVSLGSVTWDHDNRISFENQMLSEAVKKARAKAEVLAESAQVKIKRVFRVSQNKNESVYYPEMAAMSRGMKNMDSPTELSPGQIKLSLSVSMDFEIQ